MENTKMWKFMKIPGNIIDKLANSLCSYAMNMYVCVCVYSIVIIQAQQQIQLKFKTMNFI